LDVRVGEYGGLGLGYGTFSQISWTNDNKSVIAAFSFTVPEDAIAVTIYEFDASTLEPVELPLKNTLRLSLVWHFHLTILSSPALPTTTPSSSGFSNLANFSLPLMFRMFLGLPSHPIHAS
jgi:hypothetical protein